MQTPYPADIDRAIKLELLTDAQARTLSLEEAREHLRHVGEKNQRPLDADQAKADKAAAAEQKKADKQAAEDQAAYEEQIAAENEAAANAAFEPPVEFAEDAGSNGGDPADTSTTPAEKPVDSPENAEVGVPVEAPAEQTEESKSDTPDAPADEPTPIKKKSTPKKTT